MLKNHFVILFRTLIKNRLLVIINILGLGIAIGCCVVAYFLYDSNASFDDIHTNASTVYRVNSIADRLGKPTEFGIVPLPLGEAMKQNVKELEMLSRFSRVNMNIRPGNEIFSTNSTYVDADFFKMFTFNFVYGGALTVTDKSKIVISDQLAIKYFGNENVVNNTVTQLLSTGEKKEFEIAGVFKVPKFNSSFDQDLYALYDNYWDVSNELGGLGWENQNVLFVSVPLADRVSIIEQQIKHYTENNNKVQESFFIQEFKLDSFKGMAVRDKEYNHVTKGTIHGAAPVVAIVGFAVMSIIILLIACFNLTNTAIALSQKRLKEIGLRKMMGSVRTQLIIQYISETVSICFVALIFGLLLADSFLLPSFNQLWPFMKLEADYLGKLDFLIFMVTTLFFTGLLAGSYPAFYVSKYNPVQILKGKLQFGGNSFITYLLLCTQLILSLCGIVCGLAFTDNARWQRDFDQGFTKDAGIITYLDSKADYEAYRNSLVGNTDILSISGSPDHFQSGFKNGSIVHEGQEVETIMMEVGTDYLKTTGMTLVEGRDFIKDSENDRKESIIITEEFARQYGWDKALGKQVIWRDTIKFYVVGVAKDVYSVWEPLNPMMMRYTSSDKINFVIVKVNSDKIREVDAFMKAKWKAVFPNRLYTSRFMNSGNAEADMVNNNLLIMFLFLGVVAMLLSISGLFTLVSLNVIKRMKEIGVRKVLGASVVNILRIINTEFVVIVLIACVIGAYVGSFMSDALMSRIWDHYQKPTNITMIVSGIILILACVLSVAVKTYQTANMNPVDVLKDE